MCHKRALGFPGDESKATACAWTATEAAGKEMKGIAQSKCACAGERERALWSRVYGRVWEGLQRVQEPGCEQAGGIMGRNVKCQESATSV